MCHIWNIRSTFFWVLLKEVGFYFYFIIIIIIFRNVERSSVIPGKKKGGFKRRDI